MYFVKVNIRIDIIASQTTLPLRQAMLRPGRPVASCHFERDNHPLTRHWGAYAEKEVVGILSAMPNTCEAFPTKKAYQFRGMAVLPNYQRQGIATRLLLTAEKYLTQEFTPELFWLNARVHAQALYRSIAYQPSGDVFDIPTVGPHIRYIKQL